MKRLHDDLLREMAGLVSGEERDEMAIPSYLHKNPVMRYMAWARVEALAGLLRRAAGGRRLSRVIDYGCGSGVLLPLASELAEHVVGVDLVVDPAKLLVERTALANVEILTPAELSRIEPGTVDVIVAGEVLEHVEPLEPAIDDLMRLLRGPSSRLLASLPTENALYRLGRRIAGFSGHYHHDNARTIDAKLRRRGFERLHRSWIPLPGPLAVYWVLEYAPRPRGGAR